MRLKNQIIAYIDERKIGNASVTPQSNFYGDLGYDSLAFIRLIVDMEDLFKITIEIEEIAACLNVGALIATIEKKTESKHEN